MRQVLTYPDPESDAWMAEVPSLPGCVSDGKTKAEALANVRDAIDAWMAAAKQQGWEIPPDLHGLELEQVSA